jgi:6-phosphogluconolactonase/glucosamine-6-phosphate isomerase/deaminase
MPEIIVLPNPGAVARAAAERIVTLTEEAITARRRFSMALAGGGTPEATYSLLASDEFAAHPGRQRPSHAR